MPMPLIFISYRIADEKDFVFRIYDRLADHYGFDNVFIAPDKIPDGTIWAERILVELEKCHVIVALFGPKWSQFLGENRSSSAKDFVVKEIAFGLENDKPVVPIRIKNSSMPERHELPEEIRGICDIQFGEPINDDDMFRESVTKRIRYVDEVLTLRGFVWGNMELDLILNLPPKDLNLHILDQLTSGKSTAITLMVRDLLAHIKELFKSPDEELLTEVTAALDRLFTFGAAFVQDNQIELHGEFLEVVRDVYDFIDKDHAPGSLGDQVLLELGSKWYIHGAIILREGRFGWLQTYLRHAMRRNPYHWESSNWFYNLETHVAEAGLLSKYDFIMKAHARVKSSQFFLRLFANDENRALDFLCQLDFTRVLIDRYLDVNLQANPSFYLYYNERTTPIVKRFVTELDFRKTVVGCSVDSDRFLRCMEDILTFTFNRPDYIGFWHGQNSINSFNFKSLLNGFVS